MQSHSLTPIAIILAGAIVAGAVIFSNGAVANTGHENQAVQQGDDFGNTNSLQAKNVAPVTEDDHRLGGKDASVTIIEYSDFECPFCSQHHPTLTRIVEDFDGEVAWVYRHFPLTSIHSRAAGAAVASECVAELGGNDAFWAFTDAAFENTRSLSDELYLREAVKLGLSAEDFTECINSDRHLASVEEDLENAVASGGTGTPYTIVIDAKGNTFPFSGALPYENVRAIVEQALTKS